MPRSSLVLCLLFALGVLGCGVTAITLDVDAGTSPCVGVTCSGRGTCWSDGTRARCDCEEGFVAVGLECQAAGLCAPNPCQEPHRTVCTPSGASATCSCEPGFSDDGTGRCAIDPCQPNPCFEVHRGLCRAVNGAAVCSCDSGYWDQGGCVPAVSCSPNPCTMPHQSVCSIDQASVVCACDPGFADDGAGGCAAIDPCQPNPCIGAHRSVCRGSGSTAICSCDSGYRDDGQGACVEVCNPNPCRAPHQRVCTRGPTGFSCGCDPGFVDDGEGGCRFQVPVDCPAAHDTGDAYEPDECASLAHVVTLPVFESHTLNPANDIDWIAFDAQAGKAYVATVNGQNAGFAVEFLDTTNAVLARNVSTYGGERRVSVYPGAGRILVRVRPFGSLVPGSNYTFELKEVDDDAPNTASGTTELAVGATAAYSLEYDMDEDWFSFPGIENHLYRVTVISAGQFMYRMWDVAGANNLGNASPLASQTCRGGPSNLSWKANESAIYYLQVLTSGLGTASYSVMVEDLGPDDHGDTSATATDVSLGTPASGVIGSSSDGDFFRFIGLQGHVHRVTVTGAASLGVSLFLGTWTSPLESREGKTVTLHVKSDGVSPHYVAVWPSASNPGSAYTVLVEDLGPDDHGDSSAAASPISLGSPTPGTVQFPGDRDFFSLAAIPGRVYKVELSSTASNMSLAVYQSDGKTMVATENPAVFGAAGSGPYYLAIGRSTYSWLWDVASYTVTVTEQGSDDHGGSTATATRLAAGVPTAGLLDYPADQDWFVFDAIASHGYAVSVVPSGLTVTVSLVASNGTTPLASGTSNPNVDLRARVTSAGAIYMIVQSGGYSSPVGPYTVHLVDLGPDDHSDAHTSATPVTPGAAVNGEIQVPGDVDWFALATTAGRTYRCTVSPLGFTARTRLSYDGTNDLDSQIGYQPLSYTFKASASGGPYLAVLGAGTGAMGAYKVLVEDLGLDDAGDTPATASPLVVGGPAVAGSLQFPMDVDVFSFVAAAGALSPKLVLTGPSTVNARVTSSTGGSVISGKGPGTHPLTLPSTGTYYVTVSSPTQQLGSYSVQLTP